jgi:Family of unknown function (DUF5947)
MTSPDATLNRSFAMLRRFAQRREPVERCEICGNPLAADHAHLIEPGRRRIACACDACAIASSTLADAKYRRIPKRVLYLADFRLSDAQWDSLLIPINIAFFYGSTVHGRTIAIYPSPAGATESLLDLNGWSDIVAQNPMVATMENDVEALLVNRLRSGPSAPQECEHYIAPIDECFKLVGLIRARWRGLSGGADVWQEIERFFHSLRAKSEVACDFAPQPVFQS